MKFKIRSTRSPQEGPLDAETLATLRALLAEWGTRRLTAPLGVSITALTRAAAGLPVLRGTRALIEAGLRKARTPAAVAAAPKAKRGTP